MSTSEFKGRWLNAVRSLPRARQPIVLGLHDVTDPEWLDAFLGVLAEAGEFIDLDTFMRRREENAFTGREWVVTLDDGERSLADVVHPVLAKRQIPYAAFVISEVMLGGPVPWFYRYQALRDRVPTPQIACCWGDAYGHVKTWAHLTGLVNSLSWDALQEGLERAEKLAGVSPPDAAENFLDATEIAILAQSPLATFGAHTHRHPILSNLSAEAQHREIRQSVDHLTQVLGEPPRYFAYPSGRPTDFDDHSVEAVRAAGLRAAFTTVETPYDGVHGVYRIPRLGVMDGMSVRRLAVKMAIPWPGPSARREMAYQRAFRDNAVV